jgi:hypothetical protein
MIAMHHTMRTFEVGTIYSPFLAFYLDLIAEF